MKKFKKGSIGIAGAGGIGGFLVQYLVDFGVNRGQYVLDSSSIELFDNDVVDTGNLLHQNFTEVDIGSMKAGLIAERYGFGTVKPIYEFMEEKDFQKYEIILSCVDGMAFRKKLYNYGWKNPKKAWIDGRCSSRNYMVLNSKIPRNVLEAEITDEDVRGGCLTVKDKTDKVSHATPLIVASTMLQTFLTHTRETMSPTKVWHYI